jgi:adenylate kinase family enzyme
VRRVSVVGNSGSGKTTLARRIAEQLCVPCLELDSIHHQADWQPLDADKFRATVAEHTVRDGWVVDGNYSSVQDIVWSRADTVIWLDLSRATVMRQVLGRTLRRAVTREELWNGNREPLRNFLTLAPDESVIAWAWTRHRVYRERYELAMRDPIWAHLRFVRVRSRRDMDRLVG